MKKLCGIVILSVLIGNVSRAQQVVRTIFPVDDQQRFALAVSFNQDDEVVKDVLENDIKKNDGRARSRKQLIYTTKGVKLPELGSEVDVYFMVTSTGRKKKEVTTVAMAVQQRDGVFIDSSNVDMNTRMNVYLSGLQQKVQLYQKDLEIASLQKELKKLNDDIKDSRKDQQKSVDKKLKQIEELQSRLNSLNN